MWIFPSQNVNGIPQYNSHKYHQRDIIRTIQPARNSPHNTIRIFSTRHGDINVSFTSHPGTLRRRIRPVFNSYCQVCEASRVELLLAFNAAVRSFPLCRAFGVASAASDFPILRILAISLRRFGYKLEPYARCSSLVGG